MVYNNKEDHPLQKLLLKQQPNGESTAVVVNISTNSSAKKERLVPGVVLVNLVFIIHSINQEKTDARIFLCILWI